MTEVGVHEAKTRLSELLRAVEGGEEVVITRGGRPVARLAPLSCEPLPRRRLFGFAKGQFDDRGAWDPELDQEIADSFNTSEIFPK